MKGNVSECAVTVVDFLAKHPDSSAAQITAELKRRHTTPTYVHHAIHYVRNVAGDEVLVTRYSKDKRSYVYRLALSAEESNRYVKDRKVKVRNETHNLVGILDRALEKWPHDVMSPQIRLAKAMLEGVVKVLDAS